MALHNYHEAYGCFPPAYVADGHGRRMHSWRVLILPYLDQKEIYERYRFDEPWDGPNNRKLHDLTISAYRCPSHPGEGHAPAYLAVVGSGTMWRGTEPVRVGDVADGTDRTVHVVEVASPLVHWMEPRDLDVERMGLGAVGTADGLAGPSSGHPGGANVLVADGSVRFFRSKDLGPDRWRALVTIAGGDSMGEMP